MNLNHFIEMEILGTTYVIGEIYCVPGTPINSYLERCKHILHLIGTKNRSIIGTDQYRLP